ncbi:MAG: caspase family protein [Pseudomonadota bacterium]
MSRLAGLAYLITAFLSTPVVAEERLALVIGNSSYQHISSLANPVNDARLMTRTLVAKGFQVTTVLEADQDTMRRAIERFGRDLRAAEPGALAMFYYAGHGVRSDGFNYLLPLDVDIRAEADIAREAIAAEWVLESIEAPGVTHVMVLDACRNNPFDGEGPRTIPDLGDGLARMTAKNGNLVAYATGPGDVALDGTGSNSPYTLALAKAIQTPGLDVEAIFEHVRLEVETATDGAQVPWESSSFDKAVYFLPSGPGAPGDAPADGPELRLAVSFSPGRWGGGSLGCNTLYRYPPVRVSVAAAKARLITPIGGESGVALELSASADGELHVTPVSSDGPGRAVTAPMAEIEAGREHVIYTHSRHPDRFGCGSMTLYVSRES